MSSSIPADGPDIHCWGCSRRGIPRTTELGRLPWLLADGPSVLPGFGCWTTLEPNLDSRLFGGFSAAWFNDGRGWVDETARDGPVGGWERAVATLGVSWSRDGAARSLGFRRVAFPLGPDRDSWDGAGRSELGRGRGSFDDEGVGSFEIRGMPVGLVWRGSSIACLSSMGAGGVSEMETSVCRTGSGYFVAGDPCRLSRGLRGGGPREARCNASTRSDCSAMLMMQTRRRGLVVLKRVADGDKQQAYALSYRKNIRLVCSMLTRTLNGRLNLELKKKSWTRR